MENNFQIPADFEHLTELPNLLNNILNNVDVDRILISDLQNEGNSNHYLVTTFVKVHTDSFPKEVLSTLSRIDNEYPIFRVRIYTQEQAEVAMKRGSLYFIEHCCFGTSLYSDPNGQNLFLNFDLAYQTLIKRAIRYYDIEMNKISVFSEAAEELIKGEDYNLACFNLQQAIELGFRLIEHLCLGKSKVTHSILSHIKYCHPFFPQLSNILKGSNEENKDLFVLLKHAYPVTRYENQFDINYEEIQELPAKLELFLNEIEAIYEKHLIHCQELIDQPEAKAAHSAILENAPEVDSETVETEEVDKTLEEAVVQIKQKMNPSHIYLMGKRRMEFFDQFHIENLSGCEVLPTEYWLCCISKRNEVSVSSEIIDYVQQKHFYTSLGICCISQKSFTTLLGKRNRFTKHIIRDGKLLFKAEEAKHFCTDDKYQKLDYKKIDSAFTSRYFRAVNLLESMEDIHDAPLIELSMISMAIEQICLGLIYAHWCYQPTNFSLSHLIKFCSIFYPKITQYFPMETELDKELFNILKLSRTQLRVLKWDESIDRVKIDILMLRTKEFLSDSRDFYRDVLDFEGLSIL